MEEFHTLNRCLDTAIAEAVTEYAKVQQEDASKVEFERKARSAHELRNKLHTALLSFQMIKSGKVATGGSTSAVLGRSLVDLQRLIDESLTEIRMDAGAEQHQRVT